MRRHQLLLGIWLTCSGFTWPGRVPHFAYQAAHGTVPERVEALRVLEEYPGQATRDACLARLEDGASEVRAQAAQCVGAAGDERAATNLLDLADAKDPLERAAALTALGRLAPARALPSIERALADDRANVRAAAVRALRAYVENGSFELSKLAPLLRAEALEVRLAAVELLLAAPGVSQSLGTTRALQLRAAARDQAAEVRAAALGVMGKTRDAKHVADFTAALSDADESVRLAALTALGDSNLAAATAQLRPVVAASSPLRASRTAVAALGRIDDASALPLLAAALTRPELTLNAATALVARAQRINQQETYQQTVAALQRAIEATQSWPRLTDAEASTNVHLATTLASEAQAAAAALHTPKQTMVAGDARRRPAAATDLAKNTPELVKPGFASSHTSAAAVAGSSSPAGAARGDLTDAALDAVASALFALAPFCDVRNAAGSLVHVLEAGRGDAASLTQHLLALPSTDAPATHQELLQAVLARDPAKSPGLAEAVLAVLTASTDAPQLVAAHREPLLRVADAHHSVLALHALLHVEETERSLEARRALAALYADQPALAAAREPLQRLLRWLDDPDEKVREHSSVALGRAADTTTVEALSARLDRGAPHAELTLRACGGAMLRGGLPSALRERLLQQSQSYLSKSDETVAMSAVFALRAARDQRSAPWIAGLLRGSSPQLRAAAIQSLAGFDQPEARRMLRDMLRGDNNTNASNAALALAELGTDRDVEALLRAAERGSWPLPPAAAYATARITARGVTRKHSLERVLCRFAALRDSYVLSNIVSALAALGADACDEQIQPKKLLDPSLPSAVRAAAGLWLQSIRPRSPEEIAERSALLARCVSDHDSTVATACSPNTTQPSAAGQTLLRAYEPDANDPLRNRVVAVRHPDGSVFVGQTDDTGHVYWPRAAPDPNELRLEDPATLPALGD